MCKTGGVIMRLVLLFLIILLTVTNSYALTDDKDIQQANKPEETSKYVFFDDNMSGKVVKIDKGTTLPVTLQTQLDTLSAQKNDIVEAILDEDLKVDGAVVAKKGSIISGNITTARRGSGCMRGGKIKIKFNKIITTEKQVYTISTKAVEFIISESGKWSVIARSVIEIAIIGACTVLTGGAGIVIGAIAVTCGACSGITKLCQKGPDAEIPASTPIDVSLSSPLVAVATY